MRLTALIFFMLLISRISMGQGEIADSVQLSGVEIYGLPVEKFSIGFKTLTFDSADLFLYRNLSLSEFLSRHTSIFFRSYGNDMVSTVSFRGTGPSHTAVFWNGLPINQPTLGQTDFSLLPLTGVDRITLEYGAAGSLFGSDAIGGSILLSTLPRWDDHESLQVSQGITSYGEAVSSAGFSGGTKSVGFNTRAYVANNPNRFLYRDITLPGVPVENQINAAVHQKGIVQDFYFKPGKFQQVKFSGWYNDSFRELQPVMSNKVSFDVLNEKNLRLAGDYAFSHRDLSVNLKAGYLLDNYLFDYNDQTKSRQYILQGEGDKSFGTVDFLIGAKYVSITGVADTYSQKVVENRMDAYTSLRWDWHSLLNLCASVRQQWTGHYYSPFAPSFGADLRLFNRAGTQLHWTLQASRSFRIPTFNDRFWQPGGNPSLRPEIGTNFESGLTGTSRIGDWKMDMKTSAFHMKVNDWILWIPIGNLWSPQNVKEVWDSGIETSLSLEKTAGDMKVFLNIMHAFILAIDKSKGTEFLSSRGKQLPYTPRNNGSANARVEFRSWSALVDFHYTGIRYLTADESGLLPAFQVVDTGFGKKFRALYGEVTLMFRVNNLTNTSYQVMNLRAMPLRNYGITVNYNFCR